MDHYYIPSPAENGPRVAELKLIFLRGGGGGNGLVKNCAGVTYIYFVFWSSYSKQGPIRPSGTFLREIE